MKRFMLIIAIVFATFSISNAQGFYIDNNQLAWQKIFESDMNATDIVKSMHMSGNFRDIQIIDDSFIVATLRITSVNYEKLGYKRMSLPLYISNNNFGPANIIIQVKEGKYLVTVNNMLLSERPGTSMGGDLDDVALADNGFSSTFSQYGAPIYDTIITQCVTFDRVIEDW